MAFSTEFVMGAGSGGYDSLNFYWEDSGGSTSSPEVTVVATVDAGENAVVKVSGSLIPGTTASSQAPQVEIGGALFTPTTEDMMHGISVAASGIVEVRCLSRFGSTSMLAGHVSALRYTPPARYVASDSSGEQILPPRSEWTTLSQHTVTGRGESRLIFEVTRQTSLLAGVARFRVNDTPVAGLSTTGALLSGGGLVVVEPGDVLTLEVFMDSSSDIYRRVMSWSWSLS